MKIGIVGAGSVGATIAYSIVSRGLASRLILADADTAKAEGHAMDLGHTAAFVPPVDIVAGDIGAVRGMDIVVMTARAKRHAEEDPLARVRNNVAVMDAIAVPLARANPEAIFIVVSSPVDLLSLQLIRKGRVSPGQVLGTGTLLDTSRLRRLIADRFGVDPRNVHAFIIGEHGAGRSVPVWSRALISAIPVDEFARQAGIPFGPAEKEAMITEVLTAGEEVIRRKGATFFGVAETVVRIVTAIARDERSILTVSVDTAGFEGVWDLCQSLPVVVGRRGIVRTLAPQLTAEESALFRAGLEPQRALVREMGI